MPKVVKIHFPYVLLKAVTNEEFVKNWARLNSKGLIFKKALDGLPWFTDETMLQFSADVRDVLWDRLPPEILCSDPLCEFGCTREEANARS